MKRRLLVFSLPLLTMALVSCGSSPSSSEPASTPAESSEPAPSSEPSAPSSSSAGYSGDLQPFSPSDVANNLIIHYHRNDVNYDNFALWLWDHGNDGAGSQYAPNGIDSYGAVFAYPLSTWSPGNWDRLDIGFIVKAKSSWDKDVDADRFIKMNTLTLDENGNYSVWLWTGVAAVYTSEPQYPYFISRAYFKDFDNLIVISGNGALKTVELYRDGAKIQTYGPITEGARRSFSITLDEKADMAHEYRVKAYWDNDFSIESPVDTSTLYESEGFQEEYNYDGDDLGATYTAAKTTFKVWSPFSQSIKVRVYDSGTPESLDPERGSDACQEVDMVQGEKGVWSAEIAGDLGGKYYTYQVKNYKYDKEIVDPYARGSGINGLRGQIVDFSKTNPVGWDTFAKAKAIDPMALTVYETHVADVTNHETWIGTEANRGKYLGMIEEGTVYSASGKTVKTGFDHIKELGVNAVQLQPIFDQANDERPSTYTFNWGYNPLNYNVVEGAYSSDPYDGYVKIRELKSLVLAYQDAGINIIMDVVYNHVDSVSGRCFDVLAPGYFFRYNSDGSLSNGSGCGNDTACERHMYHKFMVDSAKFWAKEYKLGGFRFDLMGLHDIDTMNDLAAECHEIDPDLNIYGEPWKLSTAYSGSSSLATQDNAGKYVGYGQFNDYMRDCVVRSGMKGAAELGFGYNKWAKAGTVDFMGIIAGMKGYTSNIVVESLKAVNYVSCHDNHTIYDRILAYENAVSKTKPDQAKTTEEERIKMNLLSQAIPMLSQGTAFMLAGEEMARSKFELTDEKLTVSERLDYAHNSYNTTAKFDGAKVNAIDYGRKIRFPELFDAYKTLIGFKQDLAVLHHRTSAKGATDTSDFLTFDYDTAKGNQIVVTAVEGSDTYRFVLNTGYGEPDPVDLAGYDILFSSVGRVDATASTPVEPLEVLVAKK